jgi:hypothetical protein
VRTFTPADAAHFCGAAKSPKQKRAWAAAVNAALIAGRSERAALLRGASEVIHMRRETGRSERKAGHPKQTSHTHKLRAAR